MNILFCGTEIKGCFIEEISKKDKITYTGAYNHAAEYENMIFENLYDVIIFDVSDLIDDSILIRDYIKRVQIAKSSKIIIVASGYTYKSKLVDILIQAGIKNFVLASGLATQYEEYEKCLTGYYEINGIDKEIKAEEEQEEEKKDLTKSCRTIGVAGVMQRIGTTTTCLQLIKYMQFMGYKAAYVEINANEYIDRSEQLYTEIKKGIDEKYLTYNSINLYKSGCLGDAMQAKYDYLVCDYGAIDNPSFNKISFMEKDMKVFVAGSKPNEFDMIQPVLQSQIYADAKYVFNFVPEGDRKDLLEMMCEKSDNTIFTEYVPDPFDYISKNEFQKIFALDQKLDDQVPEKKKRFSFPKLRKDK